MRYLEHWIGRDVELEIPRSPNETSPAYLIGRLDAIDQNFIYITANTINIAYAITAITRITLVPQNQ